MEKIVASLLFSLSKASSVHVLTSLFGKHGISFLFFFVGNFSIRVKADSCLIHSIERIINDMVMYTLTSVISHDVASVWVKRHGDVIGMLSVGNLILIIPMGVVKVVQIASFHFRHPEKVQ